MSSMLCLGQFVFALNTTPYQSQQHNLGWRHPSNARVGLRPARQFIGPDDETMTLSGVLLPEITGGEEYLELLRAMADTGKAWVLVDGNGELLGLWTIEKLDRTRARLQAQYSALDTKMATLTNLSTYMSQQITQMNKASG